MENAFYFTLKALFVLKIFKVLPLLFGHAAKRLDKKDKLNFKFYDVSQPGQQTIVMHILANISGSKGSQTNKFGKLIECNMSHIFLEKSYTKCSEETSPRTFSEKLKLSISLDQWFVQFVFIASQVEGYRNTLILSCRPFAFTSFKLF